MGKKFNREEFEHQLKKEHPKVIEKAYLLANGMIEVHGYSKEKAFKEALTIARTWLENGEQYPTKKDW